MDVPAAAGEKPIGGHALCVVGYNDSAGGGRGGIKIVNSWGTGWGAAGYTYLSYKFVKEYVWEAWTTTDRHPDTPKITSISPSSGGGYGTPMTITGDNFGTQRRKSLVTVGGVQAEVISWINNQIKVIVPDETAGGAVIATVYDWDYSSASRNSTVSPTLSPVWYLAEGSTAGNFKTYIAILNPNTSAVNVSITYMTTAGGEPVTGPTVNLPPESNAKVNPQETLGEKDFATKVTCLEEKSISVERCMVWTCQTPLGVPMIEYHCSIGARALAKDWWLAEGSSAWDFECYTTVQNPSSSDASVTTTYVIPPELPQQPSTEVKVSKTIPAFGRATFNMYEDLGLKKKDASIHVHSETPIVVERSMYRYNRRGGHCSVGTTARSMTYYLAEGSTAYGFTSYILIYNPQSEDATVTVVYNTPSGGVEAAPFTLKANSRETINVNNVLPNTDFSVKISSTKPVVAERSMYFGDIYVGEASHNSLGKAAPHTTFFFPDGATGSLQPATVLTYTEVQNPNTTDVTVQITYIRSEHDGGGSVVFTDTIPGNSRKTYDMMEQIPSAERVSVIVKCTTPGKKIVCERSMYGTLYEVKMAGTNTVGTFGD